MPRPSINPVMAQVFAPPVMEARRWLDGVRFTPEFPLLNLSQAAPVDPPPEALRQELARVAMEADSHLYGPVLGLPALRSEIALQWSAAYGGDIDASDVAITSGCNQAFCAAVASVAGAGDAVMLPMPWYFNHKMWLDMTGIETRALPCGPGMLPDIDAARAMIDTGLKAIVLVTPNNPTGAEYPDSLMHAFAQLAREAGIALIIDETYRDFHSKTGAPHTLFQDADWRNEVIHLYSFSKVFRLTGHRVGAMIAAPERLAEAEKFLDTVAICPNQLGQKAALFGLQNLGRFVARERDVVLGRLERVKAGISGLKGWKLLGAGAYFAYLEHPYPTDSNLLAQRLVREQALLLLPGTMFMPPDAGGERQLRVAFANADDAGIDTLFERLAAFDLSDPAESRDSAG